MGRARACQWMTTIKAVKKSCEFLAELGRRAIVKLYSARRNPIYEKAPGKTDNISHCFHLCNQRAFGSNYDSDNARIGPVPAAQ